MWLNLLYNFCLHIHIWTAKNDKTGKYEICKNGQLIKTGTNSLVDFQVTFMEYINEMEE